MGYATKPGKGGHGLEAYNEEDGKYVEVSFDYEGHTISKWEDLRDLILDSDPNYRQQYDSNAQIKQQLDTYIQDEVFPQMLQEQVDKMNEVEAGYMAFSSPEEAANNIDKIFTSKLVDTLVSNGVLTQDMISVNPYKLDYQVSVLASCIQMCRYRGNNRMNKITADEYDSRSINFPTGQLGYYTDSDDLRTYLENATEIPVLRTMGIQSENVWKETKRSFWDPDSKIQSTLSRVGGKNCSYFGSVCYMATGGVEYSSGAKHTIRGIVNLDGVKITYCPYQNHGADVDAFRQAYARNRTNIENNLIAKMTANGKMDQNQAKRVCNSLYSQIQGDCGLCAMIMGYDAIAGEGYQFDILNPAIVDMVYDD